MSTANHNPRYNATSHPANGQSSTLRTKVLLIGQERSGKTSMQQVLFNNMPPKQTFYIETTKTIVKHQIDTLIPLEIWDCPGNTTADTLRTSLPQISSVIFVIDIRDMYQNPINKLAEFIIRAHHLNPEMNFEIFVHKSEKLQEDDKIENFRQIHERVSDRLLELSPDFEQIPLNFYLTSVYDHSVNEAFSRVLHKLIGSLPFLEDLLNGFCANSQASKAFLFDIQSRLYLATDASPVDAATHNLCCDYLAMLNSFGPLYRSKAANPMRKRDASSTFSSLAPLSTPLQPAQRRPPLAQKSSSSFSVAPSPLGDESPTKELFYPSASTVLASAPSMAASQSHTGNRTSSHRTKSNYSNHANASQSGNAQSSSTSAVAAPHSTTLTYHVLTPHLALLALLPTSVHEGRRGLFEWNVVWVREGVTEIWEVEWDGRRDSA